MELKTLLKNTSDKDLTQTLRAVFAPYSALTDITNSEQLALVVLLNLTYKRKDIKDLTSLTSAKAVLNDEKRFQQCLDEVKWYHSHNLKYPDIRVSHQRLISTTIERDLGVVSSHSLPFRFGWSHDSSKINLAKLFLTSFIWSGECTCLAALLAKQHGFWIKQLMALGLLKRDVIALCEHIGEQLPIQDLPEQVSPYTPQLLISYQNHYLSISPVVSHTVLTDLQIACRARKFKFGTIEHDRLANLGDLPSSVGGRVNVLKYFVKRTQPSSLLMHYHENEQRLFNRAALKAKPFNEAMLVLTNTKVFNTLRQRRLARISAVRAVRGTLLEWLDPFMRFSVTKGGQDEVPDIVRLLVEKEITQVVVLLSAEVNSQMSGEGRTKRFAYHPELMPILKSQIQYVLMHESKHENKFQNDSIQYIYCSNLRVYDAEAMANPYLMGMPSITALDGLAHQFQRRLQKLIGDGINLIGIAPYIRSYQLHEQKQLPEADRLKNDGVKRIPQRSAIMQVPKCDITLDIVFRVQFKNMEVVQSLSSDLIKAAFPSRYAGGTLHPPSLYENMSWCNVFERPSTLFEYIRSVPKGGSWLYPVIQQTGTLAELAAKLEERPSLRPVAIGYLALELPRKRLGALTENHCYVEPVLGLLECKDAISVRLEGAKRFFNHAFWAMHCQKTSMLMKKAKFEYD